MPGVDRTSPSPWRRQQRPAKSLVSVSTVHDCRWSILPHPLVVLRVKSGLQQTTTTPSSRADFNEAQNRSLLLRPLCCDSRCLTNHVQCIETFHMKCFLHILPDYRVQQHKLTMVSSNTKTTSRKLRHFGHVTRHSCLEKTRFNGLHREPGILHRQDESEKMNPERLLY